MAHEAELAEIRDNGAVVVFLGKHVHLDGVFTPSVLQAILRVLADDENYKIGDVGSDQSTDLHQEN